MNLARFPATAIAVLIGAALFLLPGLGVRALLRRPYRDPLDEFLVSVGTSTMTATALGALLLGFRTFSPLTLAVPLVILGVLGLPRAFVLARRAVAQPATLVLALASWPWWWSALRDGAPPSPLFQWYYWDLGRVLGSTNGVPGFVTEFGERVRWLPDYLVFNLHSEAYRALADFGSRTNAIVALRIPLAMLGIVALFAVLRLWVPTWAALIGMLFVTQSVWFLDKFNAYKPESFGIVVGLIIVRLGVGALRKGEPVDFVFVGVLIGLDLAIHPIAATATGLLLVGAFVGELVGSAELRTRRTASTIVLTVLLALVVSGAIGGALQDRVSVLSDAGNPHRLADGTDPTYRLYARDSGNFGEITEPKLGGELSSNLSEPRPGLRLDTGTGWVLGILIAGGFVIAVVDGGRLRRGVIALASFALLLTLGVLWFTLRYDTYVPRHTGLARFVQYAPLVIAIAATIAMAAYGRLIASIPILGPRRRRHAGAFVGVVVVTIVGVIAIRTATDAYTEDTRISADAEYTLDWLADRAEPGAVIIANMNSRGMLEFWSDFDDPVAARQAFLEAPAFLERATTTLEDANRFFTATGNPDFADRMDAEWILVTPDPTLMGAAIPLGTPPPGWSVPGFAPVLTTPAATVYQRVDAPPPRRVSGGPKDRALPVMLGGLVVAGATIGMVALVAPDRLRFRTRARRKRPRRARSEGTRRARRGRRSRRGEPPRRGERSAR